MYVFKVPFLPPSENKMYWTDRNRKRHLTEAAKDFKTKVKLFMPKFDIPEQTLISIKVELYGSWFTKKGRIRIRDGQNMMKALYDAIAEKAGIDDSCLWNWSGKKIDTEGEHMMIEIKLLGKRCGT